MCVNDVFIWNTLVLKNLKPLAYDLNCLVYVDCLWFELSSEVFQIFEKGVRLTITKWSESTVFSRSLSPTNLVTVTVFWDLFMVWLRLLEPSMTKRGNVIKIYVLAQQSCPADNAHEIHAKCGSFICWKKNKKKIIYCNLFFFSWAKLFDTIILHSFKQLLRHVIANI